MKRALLILLACAAAARLQSQAGSAQGRWNAEPGWTIRAGAASSDGWGHCVAAPPGATQTLHGAIEAVVTPGKPMGRQWKLAGLRLERDAANYWHLALGEQPDGTGLAHFVELAEMREGEWTAQGNLTAIPGQGAEFHWLPGHPYRLRLERDAETIIGTVLELDGTVDWRTGYRFTAPAVKAGVPQLFTDDMAASFEQVKISISERATPVPVMALPAYPSSGAHAGRATGFFHVEPKGSGWSIIDPAGAPFYAVGTDHVNWNAGFSEKLGYSDYHRACVARYGTEAKWAASATARLKSWGFNTLGAGCQPSTFHRGLAHTIFLTLNQDFAVNSAIVPRTTWTGFADVFDPQFAVWCARQARRLCAPNRRDPWLLGYFLDNELEWFGKMSSATGIAETAIALPADRPAKQAYVAMLRKRYPAIDALNRAWGTDFADWDAVSALSTSPATSTAAAAADRRAFVDLAADRYFSIAAAAIRAEDPNHMVLGCRFAATAPPDVLGVAGRYCDIVSVNFYGQVDLRRLISTDMPGKMREYYAEARRPLMMTEWSFPALDAGLPSEHGAGQRVATQRDKASAYSVYQQALFSLPFMVGSDYFMWADEAATGVSASFPEDSNYGLVDKNDRPWPELTATAARVNPLAPALHTGDVPGLTAWVTDAGESGSAVPALRIANRGRRAAAFEARWWVQGAEMRQQMVLPAGQVKRIPVAAQGAALVQFELDPAVQVAQGDRSGFIGERTVNLSRLVGPTMLVTNPSSLTLAGAVLAAPLVRAPGGSPADEGSSHWSVRGEGVTSQFDDLPGGGEIAVRIARLPARSVVALPIVRTPGYGSAYRDLADGALALDGPMSLTHEPGSSDFFSSVRLGDLRLGRFGAVIHQEIDAPGVWTPPSRVSRVQVWLGPVRIAVRMTAVQDGNAAADGRPFAFETTYQLSRFAGESWFSSRFLSITNTDRRPWKLAGYYHYPVSAIGGDDVGDRPRADADASFWLSRDGGAAYGVIADATRFRFSFWRDPDPPYGEHSDVWREVGRSLAPGATIVAGPEDSDVVVFGARAPFDGTSGTLGRLRSLARVRAEVRLNPR